MDWGLAGYGDLAERRLVEALRSPGHVPRIVWGRDPGKASAFARRHGIERSTSDLDELCGGVDAVYVATPVVSHAPIAETALRAGCHVLIEKPVSPGLQSAASLIGLARQTGLCAAVAYYRRLAPALQQVRLLLDGRGEPKRVEIHFRCEFDPGPGDPKSWRTERSLAGAGVLADAGSHRLDLLLWLFGPPVEVRAQLENFFPGGAERRAGVELAWPSGLEARCLFEWAPGAVDRISIHLEDGEISIDPLDSGFLQWVSPGGRGSALLPPAGNPHVPLILDFGEAVAQNRSPACPLREGIRVDGIIEAALRSHERGGLPETCRLDDEDSHGQG